MFWILILRPRHLRPTSKFSYTIRPFKRKNIIFRVNMMKSTLVLKSKLKEYRLV